MDQICSEAEIPGLVENSTFNANKIIVSEGIVKSNDVLGEGQFRVVFKGTYNGEDVAIKMPKTNAELNCFITFLREIKVMEYIGDHENIVRFMGAVMDKIKDGICMAVMEYSPHGSLNQFLRINSRNYQAAGIVPTVCGTSSGNKDGVRLSEATLLEFCAQIATGMEYLAEKKVVHRDLSTRSILVFDGNRVKITDFRLSRKLYGDANFVKIAKVPLRWRWMAVESLRSLEFSTQSDVWSYGVALWEIFTLGKIPYSGLTWMIKFIEDLEKGHRLSKPTNAPPEVFDMMLRCWEKDPARRPDFTKLKLFFQNYIHRNRPSQ